MEKSFKVISKYTVSKESRRSTTSVYFNGSKNLTGDKLNFSFGFENRFFPVVFIDLQNKHVIKWCDDWKTAQTMWLFATQATYLDPMQVRERIIKYFEENKGKNFDKIKPFLLKR